MALESAANIKTAVAAAAVQLTVILQDTVLTEMASVISHPSHPLRDLLKLFVFNPATGAVTADDDYVDAAIAGAGATLHKPNPFKGHYSPLALTLTTATVENAAPTDIVFTFNRNIDKFDTLTLGGDANPAKVVASYVIAANVVTVTVSVAYVNGTTITCGGHFEGKQDLSSILVASTQVVTNNVAA
jgi:hypothetical protein